MGRGVMKTAYEQADDTCEMCAFFRYNRNKDGKMSVYGACRFFDKKVHRDSQHHCPKMIYYWET